MECDRKTGLDLAMQEARRQSETAPHHREKVDSSSEAAFRAARESLIPCRRYLDAQREQERRAERARFNGD